MGTENLKREILVGVASAVLTASILFIAGAFKARLEEYDHREIAKLLAGDGTFTDIVSDQLKSDEEFVEKTKGPPGDSVPQRLPSAVRIPSGTIIAFKGTECPKEEWKPYKNAAGRAIIGVGAIPDGGPQFALEQQGGAHKVTLNEPNLPSHQHDTLLATQAEYSIWGNGAARVSIYGTSHGNHPTGLTSSVGAGVPFSILPPYVALRFCEKK